MRTQRYSEHEDTYEWILMRIHTYVYSDKLTGEPGSGTPACGEQDFFWWVWSAVWAVGVVS
jgi:hypothetical protein